MPVKERDIKRQTAVLAVDDIVGGKLAARGSRMVDGQGRRVSVRWRGALT